MIPFIGCVFSIASACAVLLVKFRLVVALYSAMMVLQMNALFMINIIRIVIAKLIANDSVELDGKVRSAASHCTRGTYKHYMNRNSGLSIQTITILLNSGSSIDGLISAHISVLDQFVN